jgi:hypothetical protein
MRVVKALMLCVCVVEISQVSYGFPMVQKVACVNDAAFQCATGVTGVEVLGSLYDVLFYQDASDDFFTTTLPTFLNNLPGAEAADTSLLELLEPLYDPGVIDGFIERAP